jgi:hypothetical protein
MSIPPTYPILGTVVRITPESFPLWAGLGPYLAAGEALVISGATVTATDEAGDATATVLEGSPWIAEPPPPYSQQPTALYRRAKAAIPAGVYTVRFLCPTSVTGNVFGADLRLIVKA